MERWLTALGKLVAFLALVWAGYHAAMSLFPRSWTHEYDDLTTFGIVVGYFGSIIFASLIIVGAQKLFGAPERDKRPADGE